MKKSDITYIVCCAFTAAVSIFYACMRFFRITVPRYYPTLHEWRWGKTEGITSQGWYGIQSYAYIAGGIVAVAVYIVCKRAGSSRTELKSGTIRGIGVATVGVVLVAMGYIMFHEFHGWGII